MNYRLRSFCALFAVTVLAIPYFQINAKAIIYDANGVLTTTSTRKVFEHLSPKTIVFYLLMFRQSPQKSLYKILDNIKEPATTDLTRRPCDNNGHPLPQIMCDWMDNNLSGPDIETLIKNECNNHPEWFAHPIEKRMVLELASVIFKPETFATIQKLDKNASTIIDLCKKNGHSVYLLSNWDKDSFELFKNAHKEFFDRFDGIYISGDAQSTKPNPVMYEQFIAQFNLSPEDCIFIDDQPINVFAAQKEGITGIVCPQKGLIQKKPDLKTLWKELKSILNAEDVTLYQVDDLKNVIPE